MSVMGMKPMYWTRKILRYAAVMMEWMKMVDNDHYWMYEEDEEDSMGGE